VGGQTIRNSDRQAHGLTTMTQLLAYSRNVGAAHVATLLGPTRFYEIIRRFGFSEITGIDLALEETGVMRVPGNPYWHMSDLGTNSFGQGLSATPIQVAVAYATIANDGVLMRPYVVSEVRRGDSTTRRQPIRVRRVISAEVAQQITNLMADAMQLGLEKATLPGYRLAGKSGTAEIPDQEGYHQNKDVVASFVGFGPVPNPRFVILVKYDKPQEGYWGGDVAAPAFRKMAQFLVDYFGIAPMRS
jgi:cell division protein FtsI/penicillin-binding protein 2